MTFEIPFLLENIENKLSGYIVLGCIIRGETEHYNVVKIFQSCYSQQRKRKIFTFINGN